jgi:N-acetyldiaminopimelate deacetylase
MLDLYQIRKELHRIPELGFQEFKTTKFIKNTLRKFKEIKLITFDFTGLMVEYSHGEESYKLFRADIDALPIQEDESCPFHSQHPGVMHACGHDMHTTVLIGLIEKVIEEKRKENLLFVFQPAEEGKGGAERILKTGILDKYKISETYALHVSGDLEVGQVSSKAGIFFANTQEIEVRFHGKSAHVAFPENGRNALAAGAEFYTNLHENIHAAYPNGKEVICEFGQMEAGTAMNAIAAHCILQGTMRSFHDESYKKVRSILEKTVRASAEKHRVKSEIVYKCFYKHVVNHQKLYENFQYVVAKLGYENIPAEAVFTGEDFGYFAERYPGLLFWLGVHSGTEMDLHSVDFLPDEKAIDVGVNILFNLI